VVSDNREQPEAELRHGYTPKISEGYKPKPATANATSAPPKPPAGSGAGSQPKK
jgi:hypothetical protein